MSGMTFEQLRDEWEIGKLSHRYAQAVDRGDGAAWSALFARDGVLQVGDGAEIPREALAAIPERQLQRYARTFHGVLTQVIDLHDADTADGEVYCIARHIYTDYHNTPGSMPFSLNHDVVIKYQDQYRREDGVWRFARRALTVDFRQVTQVELFSGTVAV
jgi:hypothetical protein